MGRYDPVKKRESYLRNREKILAKKKEYQKKNSKAITERRREYNKKYKEENREKIREYHRKRYQNPEVKARALKRERERVANDPAFRLRKNLKSRIYIALKKGLGTKSESTITLLGCSVEDLKSHLEEQFQNGMTWENYGKWHVDHIKPCAKFDLNNPEEQKKCFHYSNLQPLWAEDNLRKKDKFNG